MALSLLYNFWGTFGYLFVLFIYSLKIYSRTLFMRTAVEERKIMCIANEYNQQDQGYW